MTKHISGVTDKKKEVFSSQKAYESKQVKTETFATNKEVREEGSQGNKGLYNHTISPLLWSLELYVSELMNMKKRIEFIEAKGQQEYTKLKEIIEARWKLERENKLLKE